MDSQVEYRDIPGFPGYRVGSDGSIWTRRDNRPPHGRLGDVWRPMAVSYSRLGRGTIKLRRDNRYFTKNFSRLLLTAFAGPPRAGYVCRHLNGNPTDNRLSNLKWGTNSENQVDRVLHGTSNQGSRHGMSKLTETDVRSIRGMYATGRYTFSAIARLFGVSRRTIAGVVNRAGWRHVV